MKLKGGWKIILKDNNIEMAENSNIESGNMKIADSSGKASGKAKIKVCQDKKRTYDFFFF